MTSGKSLLTNMTLSLPKDLLVVLAALSAGSIGISSYLNPNLVPTFLAGSGGLLAGSSLMLSATSKREDELLESARVSNSFKFLYDINRGLISPDQLAYHSGVELSQIILFLDVLADEQNGQRIPTERGVLYSFPHPDNALSKLTDNAKNWAEAQQQPLLSQLQDLQTKFNQLLVYQQQLTAKQQPPKSETNFNTPEGIDLWKSLL